MPHEGVDPLVAAAAIVTALQSIVSRNVSPLATAVVSVTQVHGGDAWNVIPEQATVRGCTRWFDAAVGELIAARLATLASAVAEAHGCRARVEHVARYPATINDPAAAAFVRDTAAGVPGLHVTDADPSMASEDFAVMLHDKPGAYLWLGAGRDGGANPGLHSPRYDFNDALRPLGAALWVAVVDAALRPA
jgi:hippurate hydrolase